MSFLHEQIINSMTSGVMGVDAEGVIVASNQAAGRFLNVDASRSLTGMKLADLKTAAPIAEVVTEVTATGKPVSRRVLQVEIEHGSVREIGLSASPLGGSESPTGVALLFTDMTERRELERIEKLNNQLVTLGELTAGVVHELRNPVSVISGMAELLLRGLKEGDAGYTAAMTIVNEAAQIEESIAQFLGLAKPFNMTPAKCSPDEAAQRALQLCHRRARDKNIEIAYTGKDDLPVMYADSERLSQALGNLINNAIDAVEPGGHVALTVREDTQQIVFEVTDDGPGIVLQPGEDLFKPFFTKKEGGTGLGLPIVKRIAAAHGGTVTYENTEDGGARFMMRIPTSP
jgi:PAS domain S-box-containing protein